MSLDIEYNYPHTFFLSVGIITFIFGFYLFYINDFNFSLISKMKIFIHVAFIVFSAYCLFKGFSLWGKKEQKTGEFEAIRKKRMEQELDLNEQRLQQLKLSNQIKELPSERKSTDERKKLEKKIEELKESILNKEKEIIKVKKEEISKSPSIILSGNSVFPITTSNLSTLSGSYVSTEPIPLGTIMKKCQNCGSFMASNATICYHCGRVL